MINPIDFKLSDFIANDGSRTYRALAMEDLRGAALVDNLILLRFMDLADIQRVMAEKYKVSFVWLNMDPTPEELKSLAAKYEVFLQRGTGEMIVYLQLGKTLDNAALAIDIPDYRLRFIYMADCNYRIITTGLSTNVLSYQLADFRPLLVLRRLVLDCQRCGAQDMHFQSVFIDKVPHHMVYYRIKRQLYPSEFKLDYEMLQRIAQATVAKLSKASASDLTAAKGLTTDIPDLFGDGEVDLRFTAVPTEAGIFVEMAIQTAQTTTMHVDELGFPKSDVDLIREIARRRTGLTLVTGEMRSGKNTTIFAILNEIVDQPINIVEYSNPVEIRMSFPQINYRGDIDLLKGYLKLAKKQDIDIVVLNEIPDAAVAFAVRDLVNSAIGVITTTHVNRVWHVPNKLQEFFGVDYKTIISQLNAVINQKMFRRWSAPNMQKRILQQGPDDFSKYAYKCGVRQYFVPLDQTKVVYSLQPLTEIWVLTDEQKTAMLNFDAIWRAEQMIQLHMEKIHGTIENKLAEYINQGKCSLEELRLML